MKRTKFFIAGAAAAAILLATFSTGVARSKGGAADAASANTVADSGSMLTSEAPQVMVLDDMPQVSAQDLAAAPESDRPMDGLTDEEYWAKKELAAQRAAAGMTGAKSALPDSGSVLPEDANSPSPLAPVTPLKISPRFAAQQENGATPPDMSLAVSDKFVVQIVNTWIAVYDKAGTLRAGYPKSADSFFQQRQSYITDPRGFYDWTNHRFVFIMLVESNDNNPKGVRNVGGIVIAASQTADPTGAWNVYSPASPAITVGKRGECPDYPTLGNDSNNWGPGATKGGIYVGINQFGTLGYCASPGPGFPSPNFIGNYLLMIPKDPLYAGTGFSWWTAFGFQHGGTYVDTLQPANMTTPGDRPSSVLILNSLNIKFGGPNGLVAWSVSNPFGFLSSAGSPVFTGVNVSTSDYSFPPDADEPNGKGGVCSGCINSGDLRLSGSVSYHAGDLFASLTTAVSGWSTPSLMWFDIHANIDAVGNLTSAYERQEGCLFCSTPNPRNASYFYPTMQPDPENNLVTVFDFSSDNNFASFGYISRRVNFTDGNVAAINFGVFSGQGFYHQACNKSGTHCRWGDYTATAPDLTTPSRPSMWFSGQYANRTGNWGSGIAAGQYLRPTDQ